MSSKKWALGLGCAAGSIGLGFWVSSAALKQEKSTPHLEERRVDEGRLGGDASQAALEGLKPALDLGDEDGERVGKG